MKKTLFLTSLALLLGMSAAGLAASRFEKSSARKLELARKVVWFNHEPFIFPIRAGWAPSNWAELYERQHDPDNIRLMHELGSRFGRLHFYKGYGLTTEMPEIRRTIDAARTMRKLGLKVSLYVGGSMFTDTFYSEKPHARDWEMRDQDGNPVPYLVTEQTYRHMPCPNEPAYLDYIKKVLDIGIDSVGADQFFFDNWFQREEPQSCRCERCMKAFGEYLKKKYPTPEARLARFGFRDIGPLQLTRWYPLNRPDEMPGINDPLLQEWCRFRCETMAGRAGILYNYIKERNPGISVGFNLKGTYGINRVWNNAIYHPLYRGICDFFPFDIDGFEPGLHKDTGALVTEIRSYKIGQLLDMSCMIGSNVRLAEHMAFNHQKYVPGYGYDGAGYNHWIERDLSPLGEFFREYNDRYYTETSPVADCAVLRTWASMAYSGGPAWAPAILAEQTLIQHNVPFDIIFDEGPVRLERYPVVVLPGQVCLSDSLVTCLESYVRGGGVLVFTDSSGDFDNWYRTRPFNPLVRLLGLEQKPATVTSVALGKGKLICIPAVQPVEKVVPAGGWLVPCAQWRLPVNHEEIVAVLERELPGGLSLRISAPLTTLASLYGRQKTRETILHLVNYEVDHSLAAVKVDLLPQFDGKVGSVLCLSPEKDAPEKLEFVQRNGRVEFTLPALAGYALLVVTQ